MKSPTPAANRKKKRIVLICPLSVPLSNVFHGTLNEKKRKKKKKKPRKRKREMREKKEKEIKKEEAKPHGGKEGGR